MQPMQHAGDDPQGHLHGNELLQLPHLAYQVGEGHSLDVIHDDEQLAALLHEIDGGRHVGMPDASHHPGLVEEHLHELFIPGVLPVQGLDGHRLGEAARPNPAPQKDSGHATVTDLREELTAPYLSVGLRFVGPERRVGLGPRRLEAIGGGRLGRGSISGWLAAGGQLVDFDSWRAGRGLGGFGSRGARQACRSGGHGGSFGHPRKRRMLAGAGRA